MLEFIPRNWAMSPQGKVRYRQTIDRIDAVVRRRVRRYSNLPAIDEDDLLQEARMAAAYAVDTFDSEQGDLIGYVNGVVTNALRYLVRGALAGSRGGGIKTLELEPERVVAASSADGYLLAREEAMESVARRCAARVVVADRLSEDAMKVLRLSASRPPELRIAARNLNCTGRGPAPYAAAMAVYLDWPRCRVARATRELHLLGKASQTELEDMMRKTREKMSKKPDPFEGRNHFKADHQDARLPSGPIVRVWRSKKIRVTRGRDGFRYDGRSWPSLSAIAKSLTGHETNGYRFFKLGGR